MTAANNSSSDGSWESGFCLAPFLLIFVGGGGYCLYRGATAYLAGAPITSSQVFVYLLFGVVFIGGPAYVIVSSLLESEPPTPPEEAPWTVRPAWRTNELTAETSSGGISPLMAVLWNLVAWPLAGVALYGAVWTAQDPRWPVLFVLIFPLAGIGFGWSALRRLLHRWTFGTSTLVMDTMPGRLGRRLEARLRAPVPPDDVPDEGIHVQLSCYDRYVKGGGGESDVQRDLKWRDEKHLRGQPMAGDPSTTEVPFAFDLPPDQPPSTPNKTTERMLWEVQAAADLPGLDYEVSFEIPVFEPHEPQSPASDPTSADGDSSQPRASEAESTASRQRPTSEPDTDFTEPVSDGLHMEGRPGRGLTVSFAPARAKGLASLLTAVAVPSLVGGLYALTVSFFLALFLLLFAAAFGYGAWTKWTRASTLTVEDGTLTLTKGPFGEGAPKRMRCDRLTDVAVEAQRENFGTAYYALILELDSGKEVQVAGDLTNKQEADWLADQIREAAEHEAQ